MSTKRRILEQQRAWAARTGRVVDSRGYLSTLEANLRAPLNPRTELAFERGGGGELRDKRNDKTGVVTPAKMRALHSSSALAVNVFDYWTGIPREQLWRALGIDDAIDFMFESEFPTGLTGTPPTLDIAVSCADGRVVAVESKFTEWLGRRPLNDEPLKSKYFAGGRDRWVEVGLPKSQRLAVALATRAARFEFLHAAQLLKHFLGLASRAHSGRSALIYLYFDVDGDEQVIHRRELDKFCELIGSEVTFAVMTYQELLVRLRDGTDTAAQPYVDYLHERYCAPIDERPLALTTSTKR